MDMALSHPRGEQIGGPEANATLLRALQQRRPVLHGDGPARPFRRVVGPPLDGGALKGACVGNGFDAAEAFDDKLCWGLIHAQTMTEPHSLVNGYDGKSCDLVNSVAVSFAHNGRMDKSIDLKALKEALAVKPRSQSAAARAIGIDPASMNRALAGGRRLQVDELAKLMRYLSETGDNPFSSNGVATVPVVGAVEAGAWREPNLHDTYENIPVLASDNNDKLFALRVVGPSMNELYPDGSYVVARMFEGGPWPIGKRVVVQRTDSAGKVETTLKELARGKGGLELWPRSTDERHQAPIALNEADDTIEIIGLVVSSYRPEA